MKKWLTTVKWWSYYNEIVVNYSLRYFYCTSDYSAIMSQCNNRRMTVTELTAAQQAIQDGQEFDAENPDLFDDLLNSIKANREAKNPDSNKAAKASPVRSATTNSVTKSNALVQSYYRYGLVEKRIMELLVSQINPLRTDNQFQEIQLTAIEYADTFGVDTRHAYEHLSKAVHSLMRTIISIDEDEKTRTELTLMIRAKYVKTEGRIVCSFNPLIVAHLAGMRSHFTKYPLAKAVEFRSSYTWRLYELLMSWNMNTKGKVKGKITIAVDELREMLGVPKSYRFDNVQKQVFDLAQPELKEKAGIQVDIKRIKTGRKVTHLTVHFKD